MFVKSLILIPLLISISVSAQVPQASGLSFKSWKEQQILEAQNQVLRASSHINQVKNGKATESKSVDDLPNERLRKSSESEMTLSERELHRAQENLAGAGALKFEDYVMVYIPTLQDQPEALTKIIERLSREELVEVIKSLVKKGPDAKHKVSFLQELRGGTQAQR